MSQRKPLDIVPRFLGQGYDDEAIAARRRWVEEKCSVALDHVGQHSMPGASLRGNIENPIGAVQIPLGVAGPLVVHGEHANGTFYVPFATSEGALLASYERGMAVLAHAGGIEVRLERDENSVSPGFACADVGRAAEFVRWIEGATAELREIAQATTRHGKLLRVVARQFGRHVVVDFAYSTGDASGMNMAVRATEHACRWAIGRSPADSFEIFSGGESEKRASASLWNGGKGKWAAAGARVDGSLLKRMLRTDARALSGYVERCAAAHFASGTAGRNGQLANGLAAVYLACGQDVANVANAAVGITRFEELEDGAVYASVTLPSLTVGTVGGGTALATAHECLGMLDCVGDGKAAKLAEIVAATLLAGELSMAAAVASGEHGAAHEALGRNRPAIS
ncbi:MAG: hydroxymethylglutaryl-CoA reductase [Thermoanaerobaculia bacterium]